MNYDKIGKFILEKRKSLNLTQKELAERIGITDKAISKWERGQGCPDVSLLELLSKELGCSILELLKGREVENEVIPITAADDYIKEGINYSKVDLKNKVKTICNHLIEIAIAIIISILVYFNLVQMLYIDKEYSYSTSREIHKSIIDYTKNADRNILLIKSNKGKFSNDEHKEIVYNIEKYYSDIKKIKLYDYMVSRETLTYKINDLYILNLKGYYLGYENKILNILENYTDNKLISAYKELTTEVFFSNGSVGTELRNKPYLTYQYRINHSQDQGEEWYGYKIDNLRYIENDIKSEFSKLIYLTELIMEVGDIDE